MSTRIRLRRMGSNKRPFYRVVVADQRSPRDGRFIEIIGKYHPLSDPSLIEIDEQRALHWLRVGAQPAVVLQQPLELPRGEVRRGRQADLAPDHLAAAALLQRRGDPVGPGVLPHDRVAVRPPGAPVPHQRGLPLVGQAQGGQVGGAQVRGG